MYWADRVKDMEEYVHVKVTGEESGEVSEAWFTVLHLQLLHPESRRPNPNVQFHYYAVEDGVIAPPENFTAYPRDGIMDVSGMTLDIARMAALTDPDRSEIVEIKSRAEFQKLRREEP
jgi:hypothetical protein